MSKSLAVGQNKPSIIVPAKPPALSLTSNLTSNVSSVLKALSLKPTNKDSDSEDPILEGNESNDSDASSEVDEVTGATAEVNEHENSESEDNESSLIPSVVKDLDEAKVESLITNADVPDDIIYTDETSSFVAEISGPDAYSLRNLIAYLKGFHSKGNLRCSKDGIRFEEVTAKNTVFNRVQIEACELTNYEFSSTTPEFIIGVNLTDVHNITKSIGKKDGVVFYKVANESFLYIQILTSDTRNDRQGNFSIIRPQRVDVLNFKEPVFTSDEKHPNFTIPASSFAKKCTAISQVKCKVITIAGHGRWAVFKALKEGGITGRIERMGNFDDQVRPVSPTEVQITKPESIIPAAGPRPKLMIRPSQVEGPVLKVQQETIKALSKLNNLSSNGNVKIYLEQKKPMKIVCRIGSYGTLRVYIRSEVTDATDTEIGNSGSRFSDYRD